MNDEKGNLLAFGNKSIETGSLIKEVDEEKLLGVAIDKK